MSKEKNKQFAKDKTQVANKHIKKCSNLLENREMLLNIKSKIFLIIVLTFWMIFWCLDWIDEQLLFFNSLGFKEYYSTAYTLEHMVLIDFQV